MDSRVKEVNELRESLEKKETLFERDNLNREKVVQFYKKTIEESNEKIALFETMINQVKQEYEDNLSQLEADHDALIERSRNMEIEYTSRIAELEARLEDKAVTDPVFINSFAPLTNLSVSVERAANLENDVLSLEATKSDLLIQIQALHKEIAMKTSIIANQKRDNMRLLSRYEQFSKKYECLLAESEIRREELKESQARLAVFQEKVVVLERHCDDLASQVKYLTAKNTELSVWGNGLSSEMKSNEDSLPSDVISNSLVKFGNVEELLEKNKLQLMVIRELEKDLKNASENSISKMDMKQLLDEVEDMRKARDAVDVEVKLLTQQRDMYKSMSEKMEKLSNTSCDRIKDIPHLIVHDISSDDSSIVQLKATNEALTVRLSKYEEMEKTLNESVSRYQRELSDLRLKSVEKTSEATYLKDRVERLEIALEGAKQDYQGSLQRCQHFEKNILTLQSQLQVKESAFREIETALRTSTDSARRLKSECEVLKMSECRMSTELATTTQELERQRVLLESICRIESSVCGRLDEEKVSLTNERDELAKAVESLRTKLLDSSILNDQRVHGLEEELKMERSRSEERSSEISTVREELIREQMRSSASLERSQIFEKQLEIAQERLTLLQNAHVMDEIREKEISDREKLLETMRSENDILLKKLTKAEEYESQFRTISIMTEASLREMTEKYDAQIESLENSLRLSNEEAEALKNELSNSKSISLVSLAEIEESREAVRAMSKEREDRDREHALEISCLNEERKVLETQFEALKLDVVRFQSIARSARDNYERELQLHAAAERESSELRNEIERLNEELSSSRKSLESLKFDMEEKVRVFEEEKKLFSFDLQDANSRLKELHQMNDILHSQVQSLGLQVEASQSLKLSSVESEVLINSLDQNENSENMAKELSELRKSNSELREIVRFMKREREMLEAKLSLAETEASRLKSSLRATQKSLDEVRSELKREMEKKINTRSEEEFQHLLSQIGQLNALTDSNSHLRAQNESLVVKIASLEAELSKLRSETMPLEEVISRLKIEKENLEVVNQQVTSDASYWKDRLHQLVARYNEVDPEEHRILQKNYDAIQQSLTSLKSDSESLQQQNQNLQKQLSEATQKLTTYIAEVEVDKKGSEARIENLQRILSEAKQRHVALSKKEKEQAASLVSKDEEISSLKTQVSTSNKKLQDSMTKIELLTKEKALRSINIPSVSASVANPVVSAITTPAVTAPVVATPPVVAATPAAIVPAVAPPVVATPAVGTSVASTPSVATRAALPSSGTAVAVKNKAVPLNSADAANVHGSKKPLKIVNDANIQPPPVISSSPPTTVEALPVSSSSASSTVSAPITAISAAPAVESSRNAEEELKKKLLSMKRPLVKSAAVSVDNSKAAVASTEQASSTSDSSEPSLKKSRVDEAVMSSSAPVSNTAEVEKVSVREISHDQDKGDSVVSETSRDDAEMSVEEEVVEENEIVVDQTHGEEGVDEREDEEAHGDQGHMEEVATLESREDDSQDHAQVDGDEDEEGDEEGDEEDDEDAVEMEEDTENSLATPAIVEEEEHEVEETGEDDVEHDDDHQDNHDDEAEAPDTPMDSTDDRNGKEAVETMPVDDDNEDHVDNNNDNDNEEDVHDDDDSEDVEDNDAEEVEAEENQEEGEVSEVTTTTTSAGTATAGTVTTAANAKAVSVSSKPKQRVMPSTPGSVATTAPSSAPSSIAPATPQVSYHFAL